VQEGPPWTDGGYGIIAGWVKLSQLTYVQTSFGREMQGSETWKILENSGSAELFSHGFVMIFHMVVQLDVCLFCQVFFILMFSTVV
jgi:hypothetical protein